MSKLQNFRHKWDCFTSKYKVFKKYSKYSKTSSFRSRLWNLNTIGCSLQEPLQTMTSSKAYKTSDIIGYLRSILENSKRFFELPGEKKMKIARHPVTTQGYVEPGKEMLDNLKEQGTSVSP